MPIVPSGNCLVTPPLSPLCYGRLANYSLGGVEMFRNKLSLKVALALMTLLALAVAVGAPDVFGID